MAGHYKRANLSTTKLHARLSQKLGADARRRPRVYILANPSLIRAQRRHCSGSHEVGNQRRQRAQVLARPANSWS